MTNQVFESIYAEYYGKVMGYIMARIRNRADAEDLCSSIFMKIYEKYDQYDQSKSALGTWIFSITRNSLIDHYRKTKPTAELDENMPEDEELDENLLNTESLGELAAALRKMPEQLRDIIVLRYYDGKPLTEIAEIMNLSYGAVKLRHQNALMLLRQALPD